MAASVTWRGQNKPISRGSYETVGQQTRQTSQLKPSMARNHMKNSKSRSETGSNTPSEAEKKSSNSVAYGMAVIQDLGIITMNPHDVAYLSRFLLQRSCQLCRSGIAVMHLAVTFVYAFRDRSKEMLAADYKSQH